MKYELVNATKEDIEYVKRLNFIAYLIMLIIYQKKKC